MRTVVCLLLLCLVTGCAQGPREHPGNITEEEAARASMRDLGMPEEIVDGEVPPEDMLSDISPGEMGGDYPTGEPEY